MQRQEWSPGLWDAVVCGICDRVRIAGIRFSGIDLASVTVSISKSLLGVLLAMVCASPSAGKDAAHVHEVKFRNDDGQAQRIARKLLGKDSLQEEDLPSSENALRTAWIKVSGAGRPALFVMYGCSPTGNCGLYGFEHARNGYRLVLDSLAQRCWILRSSHARHRDLSAYMHGDAFEGTRKLYQWRGNRYVRVFERVSRSDD